MSLDFYEKFHDLRFLKEKIGEGTFGEVFRFENFAIKKIKFTGMLMNN